MMIDFLVVNVSGLVETQTVDSLMTFKNSLLLSGGLLSLLGLGFLRARRKKKRFYRRKKNVIYFTEEETFWIGLAALAIYLLYLLFKLLVETFSVWGPIFGIVSLIVGVGYYGFLSKGARKFWRERKKARKIQRINSRLNEIDKRLDEIEIEKKYTMPHDYLEREAINLRTEKERLEKQSVGLTQ